MTDTTPLSPEESQQLAELERRRLMAEWSDREQARLAKLAQLQPVLDALPTAEEAGALIAALDTAIPTLPYAIGERVRRIRTILSLDLVGLHAEVQPLLTAEGQPLKTSAQA